MPAEAVLFDFNGTLSDDEPLLLRIFTELFAEHLNWRMSPDEYYTRLAGLSDEEIVRTAVTERIGDSPDTVRLLLDRRRQRYRELFAERPTITESALALVQLLSERGIPQGIVTGASRIDVSYALSTVGIEDQFDALVCMEDVHAGKPDPEGYLRGARELGIRPERTYVFEDSVPGLRAARAAGMVGVAVVGTRPAGELRAEAHAVLDRLDTTAWQLLGEEN
ncbi:HAD superfamily hydrolase (TIGR01509 family) [Tamaricihabitans halophyticus]|uniref:HAD superfamily hydrolase (TIGR01509 family) n=1 Tax=Tamaricihabitans halophyticus TaxID=1262583 RepID=A0A4R2R4A2_9PSEU|nr:HAD family phosphatase [Tamaricihabitans halophyticus]TCP56837.1 HAD superfamily hydrolase (TIGR01509 family) [Tamaricihabitans halophyticus]